MRFYLKKPFLNALPQSKNYKVGLIDEARLQSNSWSHLTVLRLQNLAHDLSSILIIIHLICNDIARTACLEPKLWIAAHNN